VFSVGHEGTRGRQFRVCTRIAELAHKNTGDLQGENLQKYNIRHCNREEKGNRHETIKNKREKQAETIQKQCTRGPRSSRQRKTRR
jgi:hypothetical protein